MGTQLAGGDAGDPGEATAERGVKPEKCGRQSQGRSTFLFLNYFILLLKYSYCIVLYVTGCQHSDSQFLKVLLHL